MNADDLAKYKRLLNEKDDSKVIHEFRQFDAEESRRWGANIMQPLRHYLRVKQRFININLGADIGLFLLSPLFGVPAFLVTIGMNHRNTQRMTNHERLVTLFNAVNSNQ